MQPLGSKLRALAVRLVALPLSIATLFAVCRWAGAVVLAGGPWLDADLSLFRRLHFLDLPRLGPLLFALLNDPGIDYFTLIVALIVTCALRRPAALPAAAVGVTVALALNQLATYDTVRAGPRPRPYTVVEDARTPIQSCGSPAMIAMRTAADPPATCDGSDGADSADSSTPGMQGIDWRAIWDQFPSFPSGHLRETVAISAIFSALFPAALLVLVPANLILAFSRIHLGAHYPSDVAFGALMGVASGAITLLALDLLRRAGQLLYQVPAIRTVWDWLFVSRVPGQPQLDPLSVRLTRLALLVIALHLTAFAIAFASLSQRASHLFTTLQNVDGRGLYELTYRFEPGLAPGLYAAFGPTLVPYATLVIATLLAAVVSRWRQLPLAAAALLLSALVAFELASVVAALVGRPAPLAAQPDAPVPADWRLTWQPFGSFPNRHALLCAALAGTLARTWLPLSVLAYPIALVAGATAIFFGAAWVSDVFAGLLLGVAVAEAAWYALHQFFPRSSQHRQPLPVAEPETRVLRSFSRAS